MLAYLQNILLLSFSSRRASHACHSLLLLQMHAMLLVYRVIASVVDGISVPQLKSDIRHLTGEAASSDIDTRHTLSTGALRAAGWLRERIEETGARCEFRQIREGWAPNVVW